MNMHENMHTTTQPSNRKASKATTQHYNQQNNKPIEITTCRPLETNKSYKKINLSLKSTTTSVVLQQSNNPTPQQATRAEMNPQTNQKTTKKSTKNHPKWLQNQSWKLSWPPLGASWGLLRPSGRQDGPKNQKTSKKQRFGPPLDPPTWEPKSTQNRSGRLPKSDNFLIVFWVRFWWHLVPP